MPFTLAHPAAVVPIARALKHRVSLSAMLAGTVVPDFRHIPQIPSFGIPSHSIPGMFTFCLPLGLIFYASFHGIFKRPLIALLPDGWASRVETLDASRRDWPQASIGTIVLSLLIGTATHLIWDSFTHPGPVVDQVALLRHPLLGHSVFGLLQYLCSVLGMGLLAVWLARWYRETPARPVPATLAAVQRVLAIGAMLVVSSAIALGYASALAAVAEPARPFRRFLVDVAFGGFCSLGLMLLTYSAWWYRFRRARSGVREAVD